MKTTFETKIAEAIAAAKDALNEYHTIEWAMMHTDCINDTDQYLEKLGKTNEMEAKAKRLIRTACHSLGFNVVTSETKSIYHFENALDCIEAKFKQMMQVLHDDEWIYKYTIQPINK